MLRVLHPTHQPGPELASEPEPQGSLNSASIDLPQNPWMEVIHRWRATQLYARLHELTMSSLLSAEFKVASRFCNL